MKKLFKNLSLFLVASLVFISCAQQSNHLEADNNSANQKLVQSYFTHFNNHDWTKMAAMYIDSAEFKDPSFGREIVKQSRQQIIDKYTQLQQAIPDVRDSVLKVYPAGKNNIVVEFLASGTAPDGSTFGLPICTIFTIENGLITQDFTYYDQEEEPHESK